MAGALTDLSVAARLGLRSLGLRLRGAIEPPPDEDAFQRTLSEALARLPAGLVADHRFVTLPACEPPWHDTGMLVARGQMTSTFAVGRVYASRGLDIWVPAHRQIWRRIGKDGEIQSSSRASHTLRADHTGPLYLGNYFPNDWTTRQGDRLRSDRVFDEVTGSTTVLAIAWEGDATAGLETLRAQADPDGLVSGELERLREGCGTPDGWRYLWSLGDAEIFRSGRDAAGAATIDCRVCGDVGILQYDLDRPLAADTRLSWRWKLDALPGRLREDSIPSHDYLSIAVEFDDGWDLTYLWSCSLALGTGFVCPLPNWRHREFHVVARSGTAGLGQWHNEVRELQRDYARYLGTPPSRVVRVWLIANSIFLRQLGAAQFSDIRLHGDGHEVIVL